MREIAPGAATAAGFFVAETRSDKCVDACMRGHDVETLFHPLFLPPRRLFPRNGFSLAISARSLVFADLALVFSFANLLAVDVDRSVPPPSLFITPNPTRRPTMTFQPGQSGNPAGRPRGSRNKRTILAEQVLDDHAGEVTQAAIDLATRGDRVALRACMDRIAPPLRHRLLDFDLPELKTAADAVIAANAIIQGAAHGKLTVPEADGLMKLVRGFVTVLAAADREERSTRRAAENGADAASWPERDAAADHDDRIIAARRPADSARDANATRQTTHAPSDDHRPFAPHISASPGAPLIALHSARSVAARERPRGAGAPSGAAGDQPESVVPPATSARLGLFCANPKAVARKPIKHAEVA
jgi:hypothetical protein